MTYSIRVSFIALSLVAAAFALPAYADSFYPYYESYYGQDNYYYDHNRRYDDRERTPSCHITVSPNTVSYNREVRLTWESTDADYADITDLGRVSPDGSRTIYANASKTYYMTVYNGSRSASCNTFVNILGDQYRGQYPHYNYGNYSQNYPYYNNYSYPTYSQPTYSYPTYTYPTYTYTTPSYVTLNQIPYTGFDFGTVGNILYWLGMIGLALIATYFLFFYLPKYRFAFVRVPTASEIREASKMQYRQLTGYVLQRKEKPEPVAVQEPVKMGFGSDVMEKTAKGLIITRN